MADELRTMLREVEEENARMRGLLHDALANAPTNEEMDETAVPYAGTCAYCGVQVWHDPSHSYAKGSRNEAHKPDCWVVRTEAALAATPAELLARHAADQAIIRAATEYRQVNAILDSEPEPHPDPLARTILIEIGEQKRAALFAAVDGVGEGTP